MADQPNAGSLAVDGPQLSAADITETVSRALAEDVGDGDLTAALITEPTAARAQLVVRERCILCGTAWFNEVFRQLGDDVAIQWRFEDGDVLNANDIVCTLEGPARAVLTGERTALNFLQLLSGTATATRDRVAAIQGTQATILDTRKTIPGLRSAQKYAVRCGGGSNHRLGLFDAILIKENHIAAAGSIEAATRAAREEDAAVMLEVEVETLDQLREALRSGADRVLLDNFSLEALTDAAAERDSWGWTSGRTGSLRRTRPRRDSGRRPDGRGLHFRWRPHQERSGCRFLPGLSVIRARPVTSRLYGALKATASSSCLGSSTP